MPYENVLDLSSRQDFRRWLELHSVTEKECYVCAKRGKASEEKVLSYLDAVEEALCFGWIDSTIRVINGKSMQRFSPRNKTSHWTELNKERARRLEKLGLMTDSGRATLPMLKGSSFLLDREVEADLKKARVLTKFKSFHPLYQRIRASNLGFCKQHHPERYQRMLQHVIAKTKQGKMYGQWNDYGRLLDY